MVGFNVNIAKKYLAYSRKTSFYTERYIPGSDEDVVHEDEDEDCVDHHHHQDHHRGRYIFNICTVDTEYNVGDTQDLS